jgi:EAL domain-containing protein (putative c-di-GMP-specific phosphodiesterase class I)
MKDISLFVIDKAAAFAAQHHLPVYVNLPLNILGDSDIQRQLSVAAFVTERRLHVEITEDVHLQQFALPHAKVINDLSQQGILFAIDDFGSGHNSYLTMQQLNFHSIKLDKIYVDALLHNGVGRQRGVAFLTSLLQMSKSLESKCVLEGIDDIEQVLIIRDIIEECNLDSSLIHYQGFLFHKPMVAEIALVKLLSSRSMLPLLDIQ